MRFRPMDGSFYAMFNESAARLVQGAALLAEMLGNGSDRASIAARMREEEHRADEATHELIRLVNSTFVTPFDREDIYALASGLDDVMDHMEEAVDLVHLYDVGELPPGTLDLVDVVRRCAEVTADAMTRLRPMKDLEEFWVEVNRLENAGDKTYRAILAHLFSGEYDALEVLKLKDVVDALEHAVDAFESVANIVEQIVVKES